MQYEVVEVQSQTQIDRQKAGMSLQGLKHHRQMSEGVQSPQDDEESGKSSPRQSQVDKRDITSQMSDGVQSLQDGEKESGTVNI